MNRTQISVMALSFCIFLFSATTGRAESNSDDIAALKKEISALNSKVAGLERDLAAKQSLPGGARSAVTEGDQSDRDDPFTEMEAMERYMNGMMAQHSNAFPMLMGPRVGGMQQYAFNPGYDIKATDKSYIVTFDIPGMDKAKINVEVKDNILQVSGERSGQVDTDDENGRYYRQERSFGYFSKSMRLPNDAEPDSIQAKYDNGVLTVAIDRKKGTNNQQANAQKIQVK